MKYTYIYAPKNAQNIAQFDAFLTAYPKLIEQEREKKDIWSRNKEKDIITPNPVPFEPDIVEHHGELFLMIKAVSADFAPEMLDGVFEPQTFTNTDDIRIKFW